MFIFLLRRSSGQHRRHLFSTTTTTPTSTPSFSNLYTKYSFTPPQSLHEPPKNPRNSNHTQPHRTDNKKKNKPLYRPPSSLDRSGEKVIKSDLPFDFRFSYTESNPAVRPIGLREPKYSPFGPERVDRVWTGVCAPAVDPIAGKVDADKLEVKRKKIRERIQGDELSNAERISLVERCGKHKTKRQINLGRCYKILRNYQTSRWITNSGVIYSCRKIDNDILVYKQHTHRFSTVPESCKSSLSEVDLLSMFIRSSLNELEGPSHWWLNRSAATKDLSGKDEVFLVVSGAFLEDSTVMFEKVKSFQQRYPSLNVMGFQPCSAVSSDFVRSRLGKIIMSEYITFPVLVSNKSLSEMPDRVGYMIFKGIKGPVLLHDKDVEFDVLETVIKDLIVQKKEKPGLLQNLRGTWVKPLNAFKEPYLCSPLQNLLLYFPGCIEVDEFNDRLFLSDTNHHRIIVFDGNGKILDAIGSSPGFEDGDFECSKMMRPAALFYHDDEDFLYFVDSENHAIRRADMENRTVETFYPKPNDHKPKTSPLSWIIDKIWSMKAFPSNSEEVDPNLLFYPWHLLKSLENDLFVLNRSFETLWIMDLSSGLIKEVVKGSAKVVERCGPLILEKSSLLKEIPSTNLPHHIATNFSVEGISHAGLVSSVATIQDNIVISDSDGQVVLKYDKKSQSMSSFEFTKFGTLGVPYWLVSPMESAYAAGFGVPLVHVDHIQHFSLLPGRIDFQIKVEIPEDTELVEPLDEGCIWRQTRGTATETLGAANKAESTEKIGVAQQWYDELDELASLTQEVLNAKEDTASNMKIQDGKICIDCAVNTSPGTSEVIINAALYLRIKKPQTQNNDFMKQQAVRLVDNLNPNEKDNVQTDVCAQILSTSEKTPVEFVFLRPLHVRLKINSLDHPKAENSKDIILTESFIEVNVSLK